MYPFLLYIIKVSLTLAAFYLFYKLLCSRDTWHRANRILLLTILALSAAVPFMYIDLGAMTTEAGVAIEELSLAFATEPVADGIETIGAAQPTLWQRIPWEMIPWRALLVGIYLTGLAVYIIKFIGSLLSIGSLIRGSKCREMADGTILVTHTKDYGPFSWMRYIIVSERDLDENRDMILAHERAHIRLGHSWDLLFVQLCATAQWFNPAAWLLKRELEAIHEYEADSATLHEGFNARQYQLRLFEAAVGVKFNSMTNNFTNCSTKKRIIMMMKKQTSPWALLKALYVLPVAFIAVAVISCTSPREKKNKDVPMVAVIGADGSKVWNAGLPFNPVEAFNNDRAAFLAGFSLTERDLDSIRVLQPEEAEKKFGKEGKNGALIFYVPARITELHSYDKDLADSYRATGKLPNANEYGKKIVLVLDDGTEISTSSWPMDDSENFLRHLGIAEKEIVHKELEMKDGALRYYIKDKSQQDIIEALRQLATSEKGSSAFKNGLLRASIKAKSLDAIEEKEILVKNGGGNGAVYTHETTTTKQEEDEVFQVVEEQPMFPGGMNELMNYLRKDMKYPKEAQEKGIQGRVIVQFVVNKDGSICDAEVVKPVNPLLDAEALRAVNAMPKWTPGKQKGEPVRVRFTLPLSFHLADGTTPKASETKQAATAKTTESTVDGEEVFQVVENLPEYPGGMNELMKFLQQEVKYPKEAQEKGIQGRVVVQFIVKKDGSIIEPKVAKPVDPLLDAEAVRVVSAMPKWNPGKQRGQAVNVRFTLPITFRLSN